MAGQANFSVIRGDTLLKTIIFRNKTSGVPVNLTGATISGKAADVTLTCSLVDAVNGKFSFGLSSTQTATLRLGVNSIGVQVTYADLTVQTLFIGNINVLEQFV